jgi:hypothetical protein
MYRKRLDGGLEIMHVLRLRMYEGNLPIHPSARMKKERKGVGGRSDFDTSCTRRRIAAHNTDVGGSI